jgi:hypothetical protein
MVFFTRRFERGSGIVLMIVLSGLLLVIGPTPAHADLGFSVIPGLIDLQATPGATGSQEIVVSNTGTEAFTASVIIEPVASAPVERSAVGWLTASTDFVELEPGEEETVTIGIVVPDGVASGGYYARVSFTTLNEDVTANSAALAGQLGVGLLLTIEGGGAITREGRITQFAPVLEADGRIGFRMQVVNDGNTHLIAPSGAVTVTLAGGSPFGSLELLELPPLLPGAEAMLVSQGSLPLTDGGDFRADATFTYQDGSEDGATLTASTSFTISPELTLAAASVCENLDRGPTLAVTLQNEGELGLQPLVTLLLESATGQTLGTAPVGGGLLLWPGEQEQIAIDFPERLVSGAYRLITTVQFDPTAEPIVQETSFQIGGLEGHPAPLCTELPA